MTRKRATVLLDHYLKQLKLPTMLREYGGIADSAKPNPRFGHHRTNMRTRRPGPLGLLVASD